MTSFMKHQVEYRAYFIGETTKGTIVLSQEIFETEKKRYKLLRGHRWRKKQGWFCRLSAPGYMDTGWSGPYDSEQEARAFLNEMYGDDPLADKPFEFPTDPKEFYQLRADYLRELKQVSDAWFSQQDLIFSPKDNHWAYRFHRKPEDFDEAHERVKMEEFGNRRVELREILDRMHNQENEMILEAMKHPLVIY